MIVVLVTISFYKSSPNILELFVLFLKNVTSEVKNCGVNFLDDFGKTLATFFRLSGHTDI